MKSFYNPTKIITLTAGLFIYSFSFSQTAPKQITHQQLYWLVYFNTLDISDRWFLTTEVQERRFMNPDRQHQILTRTHLHYKFGNGWDAAGGFTYFLQSPHDPRSTSTLVIPELRPHIEFNYRQAGKHVHIHHRYRAEWRFFRNVADDELTDGYWDYFRFRYRLGADIILKKDASGKDKWKLKVSDEIMINAGSAIVRNAFDQNRAYAGIYFQASPTMGLELGYMNWFQQRASGNQYYQRDILRFSIHHRIKLFTNRTSR